MLLSKTLKRCLSLDSYIKPQLTFRSILRFQVVYLLIPTSNHNHFVKHVESYELFIS